jgi:hypothetical protein
MADEIKITKTLTYANGSLKYTYSPGAVNLPQATKGYSDKTVAVTSAESDLSLAELGTPGICLLRNLEATTTGKSIQWGPKTSTGGILPIGKLGPKHDTQLTVATSTCVIRWKGLAAGTVAIQVLCFEA